MKHLKVNKQKRKREVKGKFLELAATCPEAAESLVLILSVAWGIRNSFKKCSLFLHELTINWKFKDLYRSGGTPEATNLWDIRGNPLISEERKSYIPCLSSVFNLEAWVCSHETTPGVLCTVLGAPNVRRMWTC